MRGRIPSREVRAADLSERCWLDGPYRAWVGIAPLHPSTMYSAVTLLKHFPAPQVEMSFSFTNIMRKGRDDFSFV